MFVHRLKLVSNENGKITLINSQGHKVVITAEPLKLEFVDLNGEISVILNDNNQLFVEPLRVRREKIGDDDDANVVEIVSVAICFVFAYFCGEIGCFIFWSFLL